jgi:hypothetical protein
LVCHFLKKVKRVLKMKNYKKYKGLPLRRSAAGSWRRAAPPCRQNQAPAAVPHGGRVLT